MRLKDRLNDAGFGRDLEIRTWLYHPAGNARAIFLSADESANVVGNTAHLLLEIDEAQDVLKEKYTKEFKPMGARPMSRPSFTARPGTTPPCWKRSSRPTWNWKERTASDAISATTGRRSRNIIRTIWLMSKGKGSAWARTIRFF